MDGFDGDCLNDTLIGLTTPGMLSISRLVDFLVPQLSDAVRGEWDRRRIGHDQA
jgi:hypothetical protein